MSGVAATSPLAGQAVDVALRDGSSVHIRPVDSRDGPLIRVFLEALSAESIGFRFFGSPNLDWVTKWSVDVDYADRYALVATAGSDHEIVGHGAYVRIADSRAEVAFVVVDAWQGQGIATMMLAHLAGSQSSTASRASPRRCCPPTLA
jgi:acetate---CoA ligase (ADP-forming)